MSIYLKSSGGAISLSKSAIKFVKNTWGDQVYDLFDKAIRVVSGSTVVKGQGKNYILLFSADKLSTMFDVAPFETYRLSITTYNGDAVSQSAMFYNIQSREHSLYQYFTSTVSGQIRINYRLVYVYPQE